MDIDVNETELAVTFPKIKSAIEKVKTDPHCLRHCSKEQIDLILLAIKCELTSHTFLAAPAISGVSIVEKETA